MDLEDKTPQNENRNPIDDFNFLALGASKVGGLDGLESVDVGSVETSPSSEEPSLVRNRPGNGGEGEENMSQSYHEIFDTQAYMQSHLAEKLKHDSDEDAESNDAKEQLETEERDEIAKNLAISTDSANQERLKSENTPTDQSKSDESSSNNEATKVHEERIKSPDECSDQVSSGNSGNTETGQPFIPQGDVYLEDGRLVSEDSSPLSRDFLTNKLVADSLMWQETHQGGVDQPSPQEEDGGGVSVHHLVPPQRGDVAIRRQETKPVNVMADPMLLLTLEREARRLASDVDSVVENLACILQSISALTVETVETYRDGVCKTCDAVDDNIKGMYRLIARWEELNKSMAPCYKLSSQIKDIRKALDTFDGTLSSSGGKG